MLIMHAAVLGQPISHSLSPVLHNAGYIALGLDHDYVAIEMSEPELAQFVDELNDEWMGVSLTMPLKVAALQIAEHVAPVAQLTGSVNTLVNARSLVGYNTDVYGIVQAITETGVEKAQTCTILGSGATARSAIAASYEMGIHSISLLGRNSQAIAQCDAIAHELGITFTAISAQESHWLESDVVINTTPKGVADEYIPAVTQVNGVLLDVVYDPWPTKLALAWEQAGGTTCPGYLMLLHQACAQFELFTGHPAPITAMRTALMKEIAQRS